MLAGGLFRMPPRHHCESGVYRSRQKTSPVQIDVHGDLQPSIRNSLILATGSCRHRSHRVALDDTRACDKKLKNLFVLHNLVYLTKACGGYDQPSRRAFYASLCAIGPPQPIQNPHCSNSGNSSKVPLHNLGGALGAWDTSRSPPITGAPKYPCRLRRTDRRDNEGAHGRREDSRCLPQGPCPQVLSSFKFAPAVDGCCSHCTTLRALNGHGSVMRKAFHSRTHPAVAH